MANIKVSELNEATTFEDSNYTMIVQNNQSKKINKENMFNDVNTKIGNLASLNTDTKINLVLAINELKEREIYSTNEVKTNKIWIDGKPIYRKVINCGNLPNASSITVEHNITNLQTYISVIGVAQRSSDNDLLPIPYVTFNTNNSGGIAIYCDNTNIHLTTTTNRSAYNAYITLEYTKTTD